MKLWAQPTKFVAIGSFSLLLSLAVTLGSLFVLKRNLSEHHKLILNYTHALIPAERMRSAVQGYVASERGFLLTGDPDFIERLQAADAEFQKHVSELNVWVKTPKGDDYLDEIVAAEKAHQAAVNNLHALRRAKGLNQAVISDFQKEVFPRRLALQEAIDRLVKYKEEELLRVQEESHAASAWTVTAILFSAGASVLLLGLLSLLFSRRLVHLYASTKESEQKIRELAAELSRSNAELERFASIASHDLRSPLNTIASFGKLLERRMRETGDKAAQEYLSFMIDGATKMRELVDDLLDYAKVRHEERHPEKVALASVVADVREIMRKEIESSGTRIICGPLPEVLGDRNQLRQLFSNLIGNAINYRTDETPLVKISATEEAAGWRISVRDNGIGLDMQYADQVFLPFKRLHSYQERPGTGLGLPICRSVVERHGGKIWLTSEPGKGTEFLIQLPKMVSVSFTAEKVTFA